MFMFIDSMDLFLIALVIIALGVLVYKAGQDSGRRQMQTRNAPQENV